MYGGVLSVRQRLIELEFGNGFRIGGVEPGCGPQSRVGKLQRCNQLEHKSSGLCIVCVSAPMKMSRQNPLLPGVPTMPVPESDVRGGAWVGTRLRPATNSLYVIALQQVRAVWTPTVYRLCTRISERFTPAPSLGPPCRVLFSRRIHTYPPCTKTTGPSRPPPSLCSGLRTRLASDRQLTALVLRDRTAPADRPSRRWCMAPDCRFMVMRNP